MGGGRGRRAGQVVEVRHAAAVLAARATGEELRRRGERELVAIVVFLLLLQCCCRCSFGGTAMAAGALAGKRAGARLGILGGIDAALAEWNGIFLAFVC